MRIDSMPIPVNAFPQKYVSREVCVCLTLQILI